MLTLKSKWYLKGHLLFHYDFQVFLLSCANTRTCSPHEYQQVHTWLTEIKRINVWINGGLSVGQNTITQMANPPTPSNKRSCLSLHFVTIVKLVFHPSMVLNHKNLHSKHINSLAQVKIMLSLGTNCLIFATIKIISTITLRKCFDETSSF